MSGSEGSTIRLIALLIAVGLILAGLAMLFSEDWMTKLEGIVAMPTLVGSGVAIIIALIKSGD